MNDFISSLHSRPYHSIIIYSLYIQKYLNLRTYRNIHHSSKIVFIFLLALTFANIGFANTNYTSKADSLIPGRMLSFKDTLQVAFKSSTQPFLIHKMKPGQTLKGLEKYYAISVGDLVYYNPEIKNLYQIHVGQSVRIPISLSNLMLKDNATTKVRWRVIPVLYKVKPGETLFRIAKTYFNMPIDTLMKRNNLTSNTLKTGQLLHMGWLNVKGIQPNERKYTGLKGELRIVNAKLKKKYDAVAKTSRKSKKFERGTSIWKKSSSRDTKLYALHRTAPIGTIIKVYCPSSKRTLYVEVKGRMSNNVYRENFIIYLSPAAATSLGAVNERLRVELTYFQ
jgi:LysM repeat protein